MSTPLLTTKLHIPPTRPRLVPRLRLIERLNAGLAGKLILVSAPAGFGKTTLLAEWVQTVGTQHVAPVHIAWISLDEDDDDPARFWAYVIAALGRLDERIEAALPGSDRQPIQSMLTMLLNEMTKEAQSHPHLLVLDDYHLITAEPIHHALAYLLDHLPPHVHWVISTRADPPLPLARLRARSQLTELRAADLRFTPDETAVFLNRVMGLDLSAKEVAALEARTEGWIAGLQLAALSMQGRQDVAGFLTTFTGGHRYILDYLADEVLQRQPPAIQEFLIKTSILERLTAPLCDAVLGHWSTGNSGDEDQSTTYQPTGSQSILEHLERANLFLVPLDDERQWYRYHPLFAEFLRVRAGRESTAPLHSRATEWYERHGLLSEAIDHALAAGDLDRAARLIEQVAWETLARGEIASLQDWLQALPDVYLRTRFSLCVTHAWTLFLMGHSVEAIETRLQDAAACVAADCPLEPEFRSLLDVLHAFLSIFRGDISYSAEFSRRIVEQLPEGGLFLRSLFALNEGITLSWSGNLPAAIQAFSETARISLETGNVLFALFATSQIAELQMMQGQLGQALETYRRAQQLASDQDGRPLPIAGVALIGMGEILRERNELDAARQHLTQGIEMCRQWAKIWAMEGQVALSRVRQAQGDAKSAGELFRATTQLAARFDASEMDDLLVTAHQARFWLAQGDIEAANQWAVRWHEYLVTQADLTPFPLRELGQLTLARLLIAQGRAGEALTLLPPLLQAAEETERTTHTLECLIVQALAHRAQRDTPRAMAALARALALAEPEGYVRLFADEGPPMAGLLRHAVARGMAPEYAARLLAVLSAEKACPSAPSPSLLPEPLSERELEVLRFIAAGLSNREIAQQLVVEVSTVKWHINNLYGKLDVHSRTQAVARARELNLMA